MSDYRQRRKIYRNCSGSTVLGAGDNLSVTPRDLVTPGAKETVYIQRGTVNVIADNAATITLQDNAGTPVVILKTKASPGLGPIPFDFGAEGRALTEGKIFQLANSAAGLAADITWEGYVRPTGTRTLAQV